MSEFPVNRLSARKFSAEVVNDALREGIATLRKALERIAIRGPVHAPDPDNYSTDVPAEQIEYGKEYDAWLSSRIAREALEK